MRLPFATESLNWISVPIVGSVTGNFALLVRLKRRVRSLCIFVRSNLVDSRFATAASAPCGPAGRKAAQALEQNRAAQGDLGYRGSVAAVAVGAAAGVDLVGEAGLVRGSSRWRPW